MGAGLATVVDDRTRQWLITARGGGRLGCVVVGRRGPEEVAARDIDGGSGVGAPRRWQPETSTVAWVRTAARR
jgi:hypothetical protein